MLPEEGYFSNLSFIYNKECFKKKKDQESAFQVKKFKSWFQPFHLWKGGKFISRVAMLNNRSLDYWYLFLPFAEYEKSYTVITIIIKGLGFECVNNFCVLFNVTPYPRQSLIFISKLWKFYLKYFLFLNPEMMNINNIDGKGAPEFLLSLKVSAHRWKCRRWREWNKHLHHPFISDLQKVSLKYIQYFILPCYF